VVIARRVSLYFYPLDDIQLHERSVLEICIDNLRVQATRGGF